MAVLNKLISRLVYTRSDQNAPGLSFFINLLRNLQLIETQSTPPPRFASTVGNMNKIRISEYYPATFVLSPQLSNLRPLRGISLGNTKVNGDQIRRVRVLRMNCNHPLLRQSSDLLLRTLSQSHLKISR